MTRRTAPTEAEMKRAIRAALACGVPVVAVGFDAGGNFRTFPEAPAPSMMSPEAEWQAWERAHGEDPA